MLSVIVGLTSALVYGAADFLGGVASTRISAIRVSALSALSGLVLLLALLPFVGGEWSASALGYGAIAGAAGAIAIALLYACLAIGPMSILSPLTAVVSAIVPLVIGLARGERFSAIGYVAIGLALVAVVLVGFVREARAVRPSLKGVLMAIGSGSMIGVFLAVIDLTPPESGLLPIIASRTVMAVLTFAVIGVLALRRFSPAANRGWRGGLRFALACGVVDAAANVGLLLGLRIGELSVVSVLTALYPAGTIILAAIVLKERIAPVQYVGLALALTAAAMLALS